jgi:hypothetical protein
MKYCSTTCQQRDAAQHNTICSTFQDFQQRPSNQHYRSIYFPTNAESPRFIWLRMNRDRGHHSVNDGDLAQYVPARRFGSINVTAHHGTTPPREYKNMMVVEHDEDMFGNRQPTNLCFLHMIGPLAAR